MGKKVDASQAMRIAVAACGSKKLAKDYLANGKGVAPHLARQMAHNGVRAPR